MSIFMQINLNFLILCSWYKYTFDIDPSDPVRTHSEHSFCILSDFARPCILLYYAEEMRAGRV